MIGEDTELVSDLQHFRKYKYKYKYLELVSAPQHPRAANTMTAMPVPRREREASESSKRSTGRILFSFMMMTIC